MLKLLTVLVLTLAAWPALAQDAATDADLVTIFGAEAAAAFPAAFEAVQTAVAAGDAKALSALADYPLRVATAELNDEITDPKAFVANYDFIVDQEIADTVGGQEYDALFVNQDGVMFGDGQVWMNFICTDEEACSTGDWKVISIQSAAE